MREQEQLGANGTQLKRSALPSLIKQEREAMALKAFLDKMNETAEALGMRQSHFAVSHGMHHTENYSSALDIAMLARHTL